MSGLCRPSPAPIRTRSRLVAPTSAGSAGQRLPWLRLTVRLRLNGPGCLCYLALVILRCVRHVADPLMHRNGKHPGSDSDVIAGQAPVSSLSDIRRKWSLPNHNRDLVSKSLESQHEAQSMQASERRQQDFVFSLNLTKAEITCHPGVSARRARPGSRLVRVVCRASSAA